MYTSNKIVLRLIEHGDIETLRNYRNDPSISQWMYDKSYITSEMQEQWFTRVSNDTTQIHMTILVFGHIVGSVYFKKLDTNKPEWGFYIGNSEFYNKGIGANVEFYTLDYFFASHDVLYCEVMERNAGVIRLHQKFGFEKIDLQKKNNEYIYISTHEVPLAINNARDAVKNTQNHREDMIYSGIGSLVMVIALDYWFSIYNTLYAQVLNTNTKSLYLHKKFDFKIIDHIDDNTLFIKTII